MRRRWSLAICCPWPASKRGQSGRANHQYLGDRTRADLPDVAVWKPLFVPPFQAGTRIAAGEGGHNPMISADRSSAQIINPLRRGTASWAGRIAVCALHSEPSVNCRPGALDGHAGEARSALRSCAPSGRLLAADARVTNSPRITVPDALGNPVTWGDRLSNRRSNVARPVGIAAWSGISGRIRIAPGTVIMARISISGRGCGNGQSRGRSESQ
jgi:hypothetical protein